MIVKVVNAETGGVLFRTCDFEIADREARRQAVRLQPARIDLRIGLQTEDREDEQVIRSHRVGAQHAS